MSNPNESTTIRRIFLLTRGAIVRLGIETRLREMGLECTAELASGYRPFALRGSVDLLIADVVEVSPLLQSLPEPKWPSRIVLLSPGDAPADIESSPLRRTCASLSPYDDGDRLQLVLQHASRCGETRSDAPGCQRCPLPQTLRPRSLPLSQRELAVFKAIASGQGASVIAAELGISIKTYETHRERIKQKLGAQTGAELLAIAVAWKQGLLGLCQSGLPDGDSRPGRLT